MSTNKKALFFDIDGTILSEVTGKIPESASAALQKAHDLGHLLFINTGRTICCLPPMICRLPFSGYLCGCGSYIVYILPGLQSWREPAVISPHWD